MEIETKIIAFRRLWVLHWCMDTAKIVQQEQEEAEVHELESITQIALPIGFRRQEDDDEYEDRVQRYRATQAAPHGHSPRREAERLRGY